MDSMGRRARSKVHKQFQSSLHTRRHGNRDGPHRAGTANLADLEASNEHKEKDWGLADVRCGSLRNNSVHAPLEKSGGNPEQPELDLYATTLSSTYSNTDKGSRGLARSQSLVHHRGGSWSHLRLHACHPSGHCAHLPQDLRELGRLEADRCEQKPWQYPQIGLGR